MTSDAFCFPRVLGTSDCFIFQEHALFKGGISNSEGRRLPATPFNTTVHSCRSLGGRLRRKVDSQSTTALLRISAVISQARKPACLHRVAKMHKGRKLQKRVSCAIAEIQSFLCSGLGGEVLYSAQDLLCYLQPTLKRC